MDSLQQFERIAFSVSKFAALTNDALQNFGEVWVCGEISQLKPSHHLYFSLKDAQASVECIMFRSFWKNITFKPEIGQKVLILAQCSLYAKTGRFSLNVKQMSLTGIGQLMAQLDRLEKQLRMEGVIPHPYRMCPNFFHKVLIVTSLHGVVRFDIANNVWRRNPAVNLHFIDTKVQGPDAPDCIAAALYQAYDMAVKSNYDAIVLARGGGSFEDLLCFSDEKVVRAVAQSPVYIISAIGHDKDHPLCDLAADVRVSTPTAAAEFITPITLADMESFLSTLMERAYNAILRRMDEVEGQLEQCTRPLLSGRIFSGYTAQLGNLSQQVEHQEHRMAAAMRNCTQQLESRINFAQQRLLSLDLQGRVNVLSKDINLQTQFLTNAMQNKVQEAERRLARAESFLQSLDFSRQLKQMESTLEHCQAVLENVPQRLVPYQERLQKVLDKLDLVSEKPERLPRNFNDLTWHASERIEQQCAKLEEFYNRQIRIPLDKAKLDFMRNATKLEVLNPIRMLQHGLSLTTTDGHTAVEDELLEEGTELITLTSRSKIYSTVSKVESFDPNQEFAQYLSDDLQQQFTKTHGHLADCESCFDNSTEDKVNFNFKLQSPADKAREAWNDDTSGQLTHVAKKSRSDIVPVRTEN